MKRIDSLRLCVCFSHWDGVTADFSLSLSVSVRVAPGGQRVALLGRFAQLYLLLDGPSRVVDERVDQTGHCENSSNDGTNSC